MRDYFIDTLATDRAAVEDAADLIPLPDKIFLLWTQQICSRLLNYSELYDDDYYDLTTPNPFITKTLRSIFHQNVPLILEPLSTLTQKYPQQVFLNNLLSAAEDVKEGLNVIGICNLNIRGEWRDLFLPYVKMLSANQTPNFSDYQKDMPDHGWQYVEKAFREIEESGTLKELSFLDAMFSQQWWMDDVRCEASKPIFIPEHSWLIGSNYDSSRYIPRLNALQKMKEPFVLDGKQYQFVSLAKYKKEYSLPGRLNTWTFEYRSSYLLCLDILTLRQVLEDSKDETVQIITALSECVLNDQAVTIINHGSIPNSIEKLFKVLQQSSYCSSAAEEEILKQLPQWARYATSAQKSIPYDYLQRQIVI